MTVTHHFRISPQFFVFLIFHEIIRMEYVNLFWKKFVIIVIRGFQFLAKQENLQIIFFFLIKLFVLEFLKVFLIPLTKRILGWKIVRPTTLARRLKSWKVLQKERFSRVFIGFAKLQSKMNATKIPSENFDDQCLLSFSGTL